MSHRERFLSLSHCHKNESDERAETAGGLAELFPRSKDELPRNVYPFDSVCAERTGLVFIETVAGEEMVEVGDTV